MGHHTPCKDCDDGMYGKKLVTMSFKFLINCEKAGLFCDKIQYKESSFIEKLRLRIHVFICGPCKVHTKRNVKLTELLKQANIQNMPEDKKQMLRLLVKEELSKNP